MQSILCFGDSNTWGYSPQTGQRMAADSRWPGVLGSLLSGRYQVIENGQPGRTLYSVEPSFGLQSGAQDLLRVVVQQRPDWLLLMLGTNELFPAFGLTPQQIADMMGGLVAEVREVCAKQLDYQPSIALIAPPAIGTSGSFAAYFTGASEPSKQLAGLYQSLALQLGCAFVNAADVVAVDKGDGVHLDAQQHRLLAARVAGLFRE
ncbi:GDSL-type esterase/lipase family protein [Aliagarivorans marinus]|uniref:GDSL-type esterase/lipase family protein n=1 Tax=Aliagarivorans marinus TaxID=561965 RepID=UPI000425C61F|nr:GDSL-type esterase/lipase family protein [Aliagarivorans marinus]